MNGQNSYQQGWREHRVSREETLGQVVAHVRERRTSADFLSFMDDVLKSYPLQELHVCSGQSQYPQK